MLQDYYSFQIQNVQIFGYVFHDIGGPNLGQTLKTPWFLLNEICMDTHLLDCCGETIRTSFIRTWMGENSELGMYVRSSKTGVVLDSFCGRQKCVERSRIWLPYVTKDDGKCGYCRTHIIS